MSFFDENDSTNLGEYFRKQRQIAQERQDEREKQKALDASRAALLETEKDSYQPDNPWAVRLALAWVAILAISLIQPRWLPQWCMFLLYCAFVLLTLVGIVSVLVWHVKKLWLAILILCGTVYGCYSYIKPHPAPIIDKRKPHQNSPQNKSNYDVGHHRSAVGDKAKQKSR